jgi:hypothetical protein
MTLKMTEAAEDFA